MFSAQSDFEIVIKTHAGLEEVLADEVRECGALEPQIITRGVKFNGNQELLYRCCLKSQTAMNVLITLGEFEISSMDDLYKRTLEIEWENLFGMDKTFAVKGIVYADYVKNTNFPALRVKDAVADRFLNKYKERPNVEKDHPDVLIQLLLRDNQVTISLDASGNPLNQRGYRVQGLEAPLNEALAAGIIKLAGWDMKTDLYDPFCGSGTFLTEAAIMASNKAPNAGRKYFCLKNFKGYNAKLWFELIDEYRENEIPLEPQFYGGDHYQGAVEATRKHWMKLGLPLTNLQLYNADFKDFQPESGKKFLVTNPPYGKRLTPKNLPWLYREIGNMLKHKFSGSKAAVFSGSEEGMKNVGLKPAKKVRLFNGPIESKLHLFEIYEGSKRNKKRF